METENQFETFEHFILNNLHLVRTSIRIFYFNFLSKSFQGCSKIFLKVEWLSNLSYKAYNTTTAFHNWNENMFPACNLQLILTMRQYLFHARLISNSDTTARQKGDSNS